MGSYEVRRLSRSVRFAILKTFRYLYLPLFFAAFLLYPTATVFAEGDESSISISLPATSTLEITTLPGNSDSADLPFTISTTNITGYTLVLETIGSSTDLTNSSGDIIPTLTLPSGSTSVLPSQFNSSYGYSLDNTNFFPVPTTYGFGDIIGETDAANTSPDNYDLTYLVKTPQDATSGTYNNTFLITAIANSSHPAEACAIDYICYRGNGDDGTGRMPDQSATSNSSVVLTASNFSRHGYGFAGWNTRPDGLGTTYGPAETITTGDLSSEGLNLYAVWIASSGSLQNWTGCSSLSTGDVVALTDFRDNETYSVAKLADGNCWITENLRLNPTTANLSAANTNSPISSFANDAKSYSSTNSFCNANNSACIDKIAYNSNNINRSLSASPTSNASSVSWYSYGMDYNWYTATAGNGTYSKSSGNASGDICPAGWRLPTGGTNGEYVALNTAVNGGRTNSDVGLRSYPNNFIHSGDFNTNAPTNRGGGGRVWSATAANANETYRLGYSASTVTPSNKYNKWVAFPVRCVVKSNNISIYGNIHYNSNGGSGSMSDDLNVNLYTAAAKENTFTSPPGETFISWNTAADGSGTSVADKDMVATAAEAESLSSGDTLNLYAIWSQASTLTYDANGGSGAPASVVTISASPYSFTISSIIPTLDEYDFLGWSTNASATTADYNAGDTFTTTNTAETLYAVWRAKSCSANNICYRKNGADAGATLTQSANSNASVVLYPSDFSRSGYGFAGWNTATDGSGTSYGTMETITTGDLSSEGLNLYAIWVASSGSLQNWTGCSSLATNNVIALTDSRDNETYTVAKLADGKCWMTENLRLDPSTATINVTNTNSPTASFVSSVQASMSSNNLCDDDTAACLEQIAYNTNNINRSLTANYKANGSSFSWHGYGVAYNWYTATAGNGTYNTVDTTVAGDICPAGWRIPTSGPGGEFTAMNVALNNGLTNSSVGLRRYPNNFIYSGDYNTSASNGRGNYGRFWSATSQSQLNSYRLGYTSNSVTPANSWNKWVAFSVRCIAK